MPKEPRSMECNTQVMIVKTVAASAKGQFTIPVSMLRAMKLKGPTEFMVVQEGEKIVLTPAKRVGKRVVDDLAGWETLSIPAFRAVWDNPADEVWNDL